MDLALNNLQRLICHKTPNRQTNMYEGHLIKRGTLLKKIYHECKLCIVLL